MDAFMDKEFSGLVTRSVPDSPGTDHVTNSKNSLFMDA